MIIDLEDFISKYTLQDVKELEHQDPQFLALQNCWENINRKNENLFLFLVIQCAIVSYQIAWSGEQWWSEAWEKFLDDWDYLLNLWNDNKQNGDWRLDFLKTSKNNKRIYNIKKSRIDKLNMKFENKNDLIKYQNKLCELNDKLAKIMGCKTSSKTIVFAIKMFGYACTIITWKDIEYPMSINIPLDSRIKKIYSVCADSNKNDDKSVLLYFENLSKKFKISPLDLDAVLWLKYRNTMK